MAKVSKTSNLIWLLSAQLIHVPTGEIVLDDSTELKGDPEPMVRAGVRIFAERVARSRSASGRAESAPNAPEAPTSHATRKGVVAGAPLFAFASNASAAPRARSLYCRSPLKPTAGTP